MNVNHLEIASPSARDLENTMAHRSAPTPLAVLEELFLLLEDYAPAWYTEEHHNRAVAALLDRNSQRHSDHPQ